MKNKKIASIAIGTIIIFWILFCLPYFTKGLIPFPSKYLATFFPPWNTSYGMPVKNNAMPDVITQIFPWKKITIDTWKRGQIPLWNPYSFAGTVHAGNYQSAVFSVVNILYFIRSFIDAWSISVLLQPLLAGIGMYLFVRSLGKSQEGSVVSAVAFMFCGFITTWMAYGTLGYAALVLPYAFLAINEYMRKRRIWALFLLFGSIAWSFTSGHFQISLYVFFSAALFILYTAISLKRWKECLETLAVLCLGVLFVSPQILLTYHAYQASTRGTSFIQPEVIPWRYLVTVFAPDFYGNPVTRNDWFGHYAEWASFVGVIPLFLAIFAGVRSPKGYIKFFSALGVVAVLFAYKTPLNTILFASKLPVVSTSAASRIMILFSFALAVLAGFGLDILQEEWEKNRLKRYITFSLGCAAFVAMIWGILLFLRPFSADQNLIAQRNFLLPSVFLIGGICVGMVGFIKHLKWRKIICIVLIAFAMVDMYRYVSKWMPFDPREYVYPQMKVLTFLTQRIGIDRTFGSFGGEVGMTSGLPLIEGYDAMYQSRFGEFINAASNGIVAPSGRSVVTFDQYGRYKDAVLQLLGVRYIVHRISDGKNVWAFPVWEYPQDVMRQIYRDEHYEVYEHTTSYPRVFLASSYEIISDEQKIIDRLFAPDFDRRNSLLLEEKPTIEPSIGQGEAQVLSYTANKILIETNSEVPKLLFLSDAYDDGWQAHVDGRETPVYRADYDFRAIAVPAGVHTIEYRYHPTAFRIGILLTGVSVLVFGVLILWIQRKKN